MKRSRAALASESKLTRYCDGLLEAGWLAALITIPLYFNIHSERVFEPDKIALMRSLAVVLGLVWLVRFVDQQGWQHLSRLRWRSQDALWRVPLVLPVVLLLLIYLLATAFSVTPNVSWAGSYQRLQGTYTMAAYVLVFAVMASTIRHRAQVSRATTAVIITSIPVAFYGVLQHFGLDPLPWGGDVTKRVAGQMGNAIFIAAYLIMVVPLTLGRILDAFTNILGDEILSYADVLRSAIYIFTLAIQLLAIYWSGSRGPLIGLAAGLFSFMLVLLVSLRNAAEDQGTIGLRDVLLALSLAGLPLLVLLFSGVLSSLASPLASFALFIGTILLSVVVILVMVASRRGWHWLWLSWLMLVTLVAGWLLLFNVRAERLEELVDLPVVGQVFEGQLAWKALPTVGSYGRMLDPTQTSGREKSNRVRVLIWEGVVDLISPHEPLAFPDGSVDRFNFLRPLIGYGPESMYVVYNRFYPPELATVEARNASPDRSHNETFDALVITGLAGLLAWQALYLAVFYYGFDYLGVVRSKRDRRVFFGSWIGGGMLGALLSLTVIDRIYLGVAIPVGTIAGLILYLLYYALFARPQTEDPPPKTAVVPFQVDRLLVNGLLAAILAHYVEVHFGIAISATRLYFFVYVALLFAVTYALPRSAAVGPVNAGLAHAEREPAQNAPWAGAWPWAFLLALVVGITGSAFINYSLPPDKVVRTGADLSAGDIFEQSLFVNVQQGFIDSPFIFLLIVLSWSLGLLIVFGEMVRYRQTPLNLPPAVRKADVRYKVAAAVLILLGLLGVGLRFVAGPGTGARAALGQSVAVIGSLFAFAAALQLWRGPNAGRFLALGLAASGIAFAVPLAVAGAWLTALVLAASCLLLLFLLWEPSLRPFVLPPLVVALLSMIIGMIFTFLQAVLLRDALLYLVFFQGIEPVSTLFSLFFRPDVVVDTVEAARVLEANQSAHFLWLTILFVLVMQLLAGLALARPLAASVRQRGSRLAYATAVGCLVVAAFVITSSNVRGVQADMVYKRARPFDDQALRQSDPAAWDSAIAIYEQALDLAPGEDFYYLFLGRAYLERSALAESAAEQQALLAQAETRLLDALALNPLNTDHLANLARLYSRWSVTVTDPEAQATRLDEAENYYQLALQSSPQNSVIRNEYARLLFDLRRTCDGALAQFEQSQATDPFYTSTYFEFADVLIACAEAQADSNNAQTLYERAAVLLQQALVREPERLRARLQLGQALQEVGQSEEALAAFEGARELAEEAGLPTWNVDLLQAQVLRDMGLTAEARALAEQALPQAPPDVSAQIEALLQELAAE